MKTVVLTRIVLTLIVLAAAAVFGATVLLPYITDAFDGIGGALSL